MQKCWTKVISVLFYDEIRWTKLNKIVILPYFSYNLKMKLRLEVLFKKFHPRINLTTLFLTKSYLLNTIKLLLPQKGSIGLYETQYCLGQKDTLMVFFSKNKFKVRFNKKKKVRVSFCPVFHTAPFSLVFGKINMENCHFKFKRTRDNLLLAFFHAFLPKSTEVKKYDFGLNLWWCWKPFGGILLAKYKSNRTSFFGRKFCMVVNYSFSNMSVSFLLQSQKRKPSYCI
jgi:hypothetical protein